MTADEIKIVNNEWGLRYFILQKEDEISKCLLIQVYFLQLLKEKEDAAPEEGKEED